MTRRMPPARATARTLRSAALLLACLLTVATSHPQTPSPQRSTSDTIDLTLRQAHGLVRQGQTDRAIELLEQLRTLHPAERRVVSGLADIHLRNNDPASAITLLEEAIHTHGMRELDFWTQLSRAYRQAGEGEAAAGALIAALEFRPSWALRLRDSFELLVTDSTTADAALVALEEASGAADAPPTWRELLAHVYVVSGRSMGALTLVLELDRERRADGRAVLSLARTLARRAAPEMALQAFDSLLALGPRPQIAEEAHFERGQLLEKLGRTAEAITAYAEGEQRHPNGPLALRAALRRGALLMTGIGDLPAARLVYSSLLERTEQWQRARHLRAIREEALLGLAECALRAGDFGVAAERYAALEESALQDATREQAAFERAEMLFYGGKLTEAEEAYYQLTDHYPEGRWVNDALARVLLLGEHAMVPAALAEYAHLIFLERLGQADSALVICRTALKRFSDSPLRDELRHREMRLLVQLDQPAAADSALDCLLSEDPDSREAPVALLWLAERFELDPPWRDRARERYEALILRYPEALEARRARVRLQFMRTGEEPS